MLRKMARMRAAKERKRLANPVEREPKMVRWFPLELGVRDKVSASRDDGTHCRTRVFLRSCPE